MSLTAVSNKKLNVADYEKWTQEDWQKFVKLDENEKDANVVLKEGFQRKLMEVGVFGGSEFFKRVPARLCDEIEDDYPRGRTCLVKTPYPITRIFLNISDNIPKQEDLTLVWGDQLFRLSLNESKSWQISYPIVMRNDNDKQYLADMPDMFLQIREIASIEKTAHKAKEVLDQLLIPAPLTRLIVEEYCGASRFPPQSVQKSAERMKDIRLTLFATFRPRAVVNKDLFYDYLRRETGIESEKVSSIVTEYIGETDIADEESAPAKV